MDHALIRRELFGANKDLEISVTHLNDNQYIVTYENSVEVNGNTYSAMNACDAISTRTHIAIITSATICVIPRTAVAQYPFKKHRLSLYLIWFVLTLITVLINLYIINPKIL